MDALRLCLASSTTLQKVPREENVSYSVWGRVVNVYDGDTITLALVVRGKIVRRRCRLAGCDAPEMRGDKEAAIISREALKALLPTGIVRVRVLGLEKYGRLLIRIPTKRGDDASVEMIRDGFAVAYDGGTKK